MAKLVFEIPDNPVTKDDFFKDGKFQHLALFPTKTEELRNTLESNKTLNKRTKGILFVMIHEVINILNESGFYKWLPDLLKPVISTILVLKLMQSKQLIQLIKGE